MSEPGTRRLVWLKQENTQHRTPNIQSLKDLQGSSRLSFATFKHSLFDVGCWMFSN
jgi:hypothetical protein